MQVNSKCGHQVCPPFTQISRCASEAEMQQRRHAMVETDLLCDLAV
jgi:hypothetical protein